MIKSRGEYFDSNSDGEYFVSISEGVYFVSMSDRANVVTSISGVLLYIASKVEVSYLVSIDELVV